MKGAHLLQDRWMDIELLERTILQAGEPSFRGRQVWEWLVKGAESYEQMSNLPKGLRQMLSERVPISSLRTQRQATSRDGTVKALFHTSDKRPVEAVLMRYKDGRRSICLSSQSGCPLTCTFCATGAMKFGRNLSTSEILDQALHLLRAQGGDGLTNCVFMGMGEPLMNLDAVLGACERLPDIGISNRHTTISTVGWIPGIEELAKRDMPLRLALSLHAAEESLRSQLMPVNDRYPLKDVIAACEAFYARRRRRIFVEYVMLSGVNDLYQQAVLLAKLLNGARGESGRTIFKVNLIPWNPVQPPPFADGANGNRGNGNRGNDDSTNGDGANGDGATEPAPPRFAGASKESIAAFKAALIERGIPATVRLTRGQDIDAACGQLAAKAA